MRFIITGRNIDITEGLKSAVEEKLGKLDRFFAWFRYLAYPLRGRYCR